MVHADAYFPRAFMRARCFPELVSLEARNGCLSFSFLPHRQREAVIELAYNSFNSYERIFQMRCACGAFVIFAMRRKIVIFNSLLAEASISPNSFQRSTIIYNLNYYEIFEIESGT